MVVEPIRVHYEGLIEKGDYSAAARYLMRNPEIIHDISISDFADVYLSYRSRLPQDEAVGLLRMLVREISADHGAEVVLSKKR